MAEDLHVCTLSTALPNLVRRIETLVHQQTSTPRKRILIALAGVPGSGKSTVSTAVLQELTLRGMHDVAIVPMDGFHYSRSALSGFPDPELALRRRGAPFTFDAEGCVELVKVLGSMAVTEGDEPECMVLLPSFDHAVKDPVLDDISISSRTRVVIVEGNYTLLDRKPWNQIAEVCHERWFVDAPVEIVRNRLVQRHLAAGIEISAAAATKRAEENDIPNGELIRSLLIQPDVIIEN